MVRYTCTTISITNPPTNTTPPEAVSAIPNLLCYEELIAEGAPEFDWPQFDENTASSLCYTSGTTGNPKGVLYSHRALVLQEGRAVLAGASGEKAVHLCFGNYGGQTIQRGSYDQLLTFLNSLRCDHLVLELARCEYVAPRERHRLRLQRRGPRGRRWRPSP